MHPAGYAYRPWCGSPPDPALIWQTWRLDPLVLTLLVVLFGALVALLVRRGDAATRSRLTLLSSGWTIATLGLVSPLCPLSVALFSARATQHMLLTMVAAPLVAAGLGRVLPHSSRPSLAHSPLVAAFVFAAVVWFWHAPAPYTLTFDSDGAYWAMHVTLFASALWLWHRLIGPDATPIGTLLASLVSTVQMGFLGALITLAPHPIYAPHFMTTDAWGLLPLEDQELGGAIMWVLGCVVFVAVSMLSSRTLLQRRDGREANAPHVGQPA